MRLHEAYSLRKGDDGDSSDSGGGMRGGRGSYTAERDQTQAERNMASGASKVGGAIVSAMGGPLAGAGASRLIDKMTGGPVGIDLRTGQRTGGSYSSSSDNFGSDKDNRSGGQFSAVGASGQQLQAQQQEQARVNAITEAANIELTGARESIAEQRRQFDIGQGNLEPFRQAGVGALEKQQAYLGLSGQQAQQDAFDSFTESPGQAFLRKRGLKARLASASATGQLGGGNTQMAIEEYGQGVAQQQLSDQQNRLAGISGTGQSTAVTQAGLGSQFAANVGNLQQGAAQSRASGLLANQALEQQQATADSQASAARRQQNIALGTAVAPAAFDFISGFF